MEEDSRDSNLNAVEEFAEAHDANLLNCRTMEEEKLRAKLKFFFMDPVQKWKLKQRFPYKLGILVAKIILATVQLCLFARHRTHFIDYVFHNRLALCHLFLLGWDSTMEITSYPPQTGDLALYTIPDFYSALDLVLTNYANLDRAIGAYDYLVKNDTTASTIFCIRHRNEPTESYENDIYNNEIKISTFCTAINLTRGQSNFSSEDYFRQHNIDIKFPYIIDAKLFFAMKTFNYKTVPMDCLTLNVTVYFDNRAQEGRFLYSLDLAMDRLRCNKNFNFESSLSQFILISILNSFVIISCVLSGVLCLRAIYRAQILERKTVEFFKEHFGKDLSWKGKLEFLNLWYVTMIVGDLLILIGSAIKEKIERNQFYGDEWNICGLALGVGNFLTWFSVLRYLCFFKTYNTIILTMKTVAPTILRFMVCVLIIYAGFTFCGWLVLGPYHMKFRTLWGTSECLFALINGDDVYGTFTMLQPTKSLLIWWFCRIFLYTFISLFIYVVLSLFLSLISDAYEDIKKLGEEVLHKTDVRRFIEADLSESEIDSVATTSTIECTCYSRNSFKTVVEKIINCRKSNSQK